MYDAERARWVENDEGLYLAWKRSGQGLRPWVRDNREEIDAYIERELSRGPSTH